MKKYKFSEYTENMYLNNRSKVWSYFNNLRNKKIMQLITKTVNKNDSILEIGSYDGYFISRFLEEIQVEVKNIDLLDLYDTEKDFLKDLIVHNVNLFQSIKPSVQFNIISGSAENNESLLKYDKIFIFETLEHVNDETIVIKNIKNSLKQNGIVYVSLPVEFGMLFFIKDLGRRFINKDQYHKWEELFWGTIGKPKKIKRIPRQHKGYDYRDTITSFKNKGLNLIYEIGYPFNNSFFAYGKILVFKNN